MKENDYPKPLYERSLEELQLLLSELLTEEKRLLDLQAKNPEIDKLPNDIGLDAKSYAIWQSLSKLKGDQLRICKVKNAINAKNE